MIGTVDPSEPRHSARPAKPARAKAAPVIADDTEETELLTGEAVGLDVRPASLILRAAGALIDWLAYVGFFLFLVLMVFVATEWQGVDGALGSALLIAALVLSFVILPTVVETVSRGRSLGKLAIGARIVRDDGGAIGLRHAVVRSLTAFLEILMTLGGLAAIVSLLNSRAKRLGDLLAGTYSQHERVPRVVEPVYGVPEELTNWATLADVGKLPDALNRRINSYLKQANRLTPESRLRLGDDLAREAAAFVSPVPNTSSELFLAGVAAIRRERELRGLQLERDRLARLEPVLTGRPHGFPNR